MKFTVALILTALSSFAACLFLPWWIIAVCAFAVAIFIKQPAVAAFGAAFSGLLLLWGGLALYISGANGDVISHKVSMLILKVDNPLLLIAATALTGAIVAGFAALSGSLLVKPHTGR